MAEVLALRARAATHDPPLARAIDAALQIVTSALHLYSRPGELSLSFNGGKDSTVVLHLLRAALLERGDAGGGCCGACGRSQRGEGGVAGDVGAGMGESTGARVGARASALGDGAAATAVPTPAPCVCPARVVYFEGSGAEFPEVAAFMAACEPRYGFSVEHLPGFTRGLRTLVDGSQGASPRLAVRGVLMGTRRGDPDAATLSGPFSPTSPSWPPVMRVCPILDWSYAHVWAFLRGAALPYCRLYDEGYTSLGSPADSAPNDALRVGAGGGGGGGGDAPTSSARDCRGVVIPSSGDTPRYLPAWALRDGALERAGRGGR